MKIFWKHQVFSDLSSDELYRILQLRVNIFINEQKCFYPELDDKDFLCTHLWTEINGEIIAYARLVPPDISYPEPSIGRIATHPSFRGNQYGRLLVEKAIAFTKEKHGHTAIQIGAQTYLKKFYEGFGFTQKSEEYLDFGIPHIDMIKP